MSMFYNKILNTRTPKGLNEVKQAMPKIMLEIQRNMLMHRLCSAQAVLGSCILALGSNF